MSSADSDRPRGRPVMKERIGGKGEPVKPSPTPAALDHGRHPADELGRPLQTPHDMREPTEEELAAIRAAEAQKARQLYAEAIRVQDELGILERWQRQLTKSLGLITAAVLALVGLNVFANTAQILADLAVQPVAVR